MFTKTKSRQCPTCGSELESSGDCNACLLQLGLDGADKSQPAPADPMLPSIEELNERFPQLEVTRLVGRGGMGAIYHARQKALDRDVALKLIAREVSSDPAFVERFEREAKALAKLSHPNIVTIFDFGRTSDGTAYLILEYVDGINLREAIANGSLGADDAIPIVSKICDALEYAHSKGVVHRDIKPENILLGEDGTLKVADFGIAKIVDESVRIPTLTASRQVLGSLHYLAPEHLEAPGEVDHRVDLYALGVVFYELLTGQLPLGRYEAPSHVHDRLDPRVDPIVMRSLSRRPKQRYQNAADLNTDIHRLQGSTDAAPAAAAAAADESDDRTSVSVPFSCDAIEGLSEVVGVIHGRGDVLHIEYRVRDAIFGQIKSQTKVVKIPRSNITRLELVRGFLGAKLVIATDTISALGPLPEAETGRVELSIDRNDEAYAREVTHAMGFDAIQTVGRQTGGGPIRWPDEPNDAQRQMFGVLMILSAVLNGGGLAILEYTFATELNDVALVASIIGAAVLIGPLAILQLVTGILALIGPARSLSLVTSILSMVPLSPAWLISMPTGVWGHFLFRKHPGGPVVPSNDVDSSPGWGATTLVLLRESKWARVTGILGTIGGIALIAGVTAAQLGFVPVSMRYRVVDPNVNANDLDDVLENRLQLASGFRGLRYDSRLDPTTVYVRTWHRYRDEVDSALSVQETPQLIWLEMSDPSEEDSEDSDSEDGDFGGERERDKTDRLARSRQVPLATGLDIGRCRVEHQNLGAVVFATGEAFQLSSELVGKVSGGRGASEVAVELTSKGRERLAASVASVASSDSTGGLALVIGGLVEAIALDESIGQKQITFQLPTRSTLSREGIVAGIRGPSLPTQLELLDK